MPESEKDPVLNDAERQAVNDALEAILATDKFEAAPQMSAFLRYVVEQAANGNQNRIKAFTVAVDALGKPDTFDPQNDPVVRVLAGRLRAALSIYNDENPNAPLIITMTPGSYVPTFQTRQSVNKVADEDARNISREDEQATAAPIPVCEQSATGSAERSIDVQSDESKISSTVRDTDVTSKAVTADGYAGDTRKTSMANENSGLAGLFGKVSQLISQAPKRVLAGALVVSLGVGIIQNKEHIFSEPDMHAAVPAYSTSNPATLRPRPEEPSLFISAVDHGSALENSLNAVISGVISESNEVKVYRILDNDRDTNFWPEDYILTVTILELPGETRVTLQLMEAATGRILNSQVVQLNELAHQQLTQKELTRIIDTARAMVNENGPLIEDYLSKKISARQ